MKSYFSALILFLFSEKLFSQKPILIAESMSFGNVNHIKNITKLNSKIFFSAFSTDFGNEIWSSDGTASGTNLLKDIYTGEADSYPNYFVVANNKIFFTAYQLGTGNELWKTDGTVAGTVLVKDILVGNNGSSPAYLHEFNGEVYFLINSNSDLWKSDGTAAGTVFVKTVLPTPPPNGVYYTKIFSSNSHLFLIIGNTNGQRELWKSDGTTAGTQIIKTFVGEGVATPNNMGNTAYFVADDGISGTELWKTDGTVAGTVIVKDIAAGNLNSNPANLTVFNNELFFTSGSKLYKTDGTAAGTVKIDIIGFSNYLAKSNGSLYMGWTSNGFTKVYKSDGTDAGKVFLTEFYNPLGKIAFNGTPNGNVYFAGHSYETGFELWKTNGTPETTQIFDDIRPGIHGSFPSSFENINNKLLFTANNGTSGYELFSTNTDLTGTTLLKDIEPNEFSSNPVPFATLGQQLFYSTQDYNYNYTSIETFLKRVDNNNIFNTFNQYLNPSDFLVFNKKMYFQAEKFDVGSELMVSEGTNATTSNVLDIFAGATNHSNPAELTTAGTNFFFAATNSSDRELWKSDGTGAGTQLVKNINQFGSSNPNHLIEFNDDLYFFAKGSGRTDPDLWKSDGTSAGTSSLSAPDIDAATDEISKIGRFLIFSATNSSNGNELFVTTNTTISLLKDINTGTGSGNPNKLTPVGSTLYFKADDGINGAELWKTGGTTQNTVLVKDIRAGASNGNPTNLFNHNGILYFAANDGINGSELWKTDGTAAGTIMVKDIYEGSLSSSPSSFCTVGNTLYFEAYHPQHGKELWKTDGTAEGTVLVYDLYEDYELERNNALPTNLINNNGILYFTATNAINGRELFKFIPCPLEQVFTSYTFPPSNTFHAAEDIRAYHKINHGKTLNYFAGNSIILGTGFSVSAQDASATYKNVFRAEIRGCN